MTTTRRDEAPPAVGIVEARRRFLDHGRERSRELASPAVESPAAAPPIDEELDSSIERATD